MVKEERTKRKLWRNLKLSAFVVGAAPWLIPDPGSLSKDYENELTASECKKLLDDIILSIFKQADRLKQ